MKNAFILLSLLSLSLVPACGSGPAANGTANANADTNANSATNAVAATNTTTVATNANGGPVEIKLDPNNMPPGLSANPVIVNGNVNANTKLKKGTTPTPGIPSDAEIKKTMKPSTAPPANAPPMMKSTKKPAATP